MRVCGGVGGWGIPRVLSALRAATDVRNDKVSLRAVLDRFVRL